MLIPLAQQLNAGRDLTRAEVTQAVAELTGETASVEVKAEFLLALSNKGETQTEITAFVQELRARAVVPPLHPETLAQPILDVCGTGGDQLNTFNISTTVTLIVAAAGAAVAKHGNRAITSQSGSADVLEALGIKIDLTPEKAAEWLHRHHFAFFFAPLYHPAFKNLAAARKLCASMGKRTIFNFLGPLLNPARPSAQLVGVARPELCPVIAGVLQELGAKQGMAVCGEVEDQGEKKQMDEFSILGANDVVYFSRHALHQRRFSPQIFDLPSVQLTELQGGDRHLNAGIIRRILHGQERGAKRNAVLINCGFALYLAGKSLTARAGFALAAEVIDSGQAAKKLQELIIASERA